MTRFIETVYGKDGVYETPYLTRVSLGPLRLHIFHRGDNDPDFHDHQMDFWTFPLTSYLEDVFYPKTGLIEYHLVKAFRLHYRPAEHAHRIEGRFGKTGPIVTLCWFRPKRRSWGFWIKANKAWVPWRAYVFGEVG